MPDLAVAGLVLGVTAGLAYGTLAVGIVLVYRSSGIVNFAHAEIGTFGAAVLLAATARWHLPYWVAFPLGMAAAAAAGASVEAAVARRLRRVPRVMTMIGTLGAGQVLLYGALALGGRPARSLFPLPPGFPTIDAAGGLRLTPAHTAILVLAPAMLVALSLFLRRTRLGLAVRGAGVDAEAAVTSGIPAARMATLSWGLAGAAAAATTILVYPTLGLVAPEGAGPGLLVRALGAAALAGMTSLPRALAAGIGLGVVEQSLALNVASLGAVEAVLFVAILAALWAQRPRAEAAERPGAWGAVQPWRPVPDWARTAWPVRNLGRLAAGAALALALLVPVVLDSGSTMLLAHVLGVAIVGLSANLVTGIGGQLSLGQFAVAGVGAAVSYAVTVTTGNFIVGFTAAALVGAASSVMVGAPGGRHPGISLTVTTLAFAVAAETWLLRQSWMLGGSPDPGRPIIGPFTLDTAEGYYLLTVVFVVAAMVVYRNLQSGSFGRVLVAVRDNEAVAQTFTIRPRRRRLEAFAAAGVLAGVGGAVYGHGLASLSADAFAAKASIDVVAVVALGGLGSVAGPVLGALYVIGVPAFVPLDAAALAAGALGWLLLLLYVPAGLPGLLRPARDGLVAWLARFSEDETTPAAEDDPPALVHLPPLVSRAQRRPTTPVTLEVRALSKAFGGLRALDAVSLRVGPGETLGVIGPNGAGKTTLFDVVSGLVAADAGSVLLDGRDITSMPPPRRAELGLARSFQEPWLFPTMAVLDAVRLAGERALSASVFRSAFGVRRSGRSGDEAACALVELFGLGPHVHKLVGELSTGTRRVVELACMAGLQPRLLLLDEPSAGLAQGETDALAELLRRLKEELCATFVVIEHDLDLVAQLSDRLVVMADGRVFADGMPGAVLRDAAVVAAWDADRQVHAPGAASTLEPKDAER